jgi:hypothetical protein
VSGGGQAVVVRLWWSGCGGQAVLDAQPCVELARAWPHVTACVLCAAPSRRYGTHLSDTWHLDLDTYTWARVPQPPALLGTPPAPPAVFSHSLSAWRGCLLLLGGCPTAHHASLFVLSLASHKWTALDTAVEDGVPALAAEAARGSQPGLVGEGGAAGGSAAAGEAAGSGRGGGLGGELGFVPLRHSAEVVALPPGGSAEQGGGGEQLVVLGGGAFCFSFG